MKPDNACRAGLVRCAKLPSTATAADAADPHIFHLPGGYTTFVGSAAQLTDEGLIPSGTIWPHQGGMTSWQDEGLQFQLFRRTSPRRINANGSAAQDDRWMLFVQLDALGDRRCFARALLMRQLERDLFWLSDEGEALKSWISGRARAARNDANWQKFKACIPGLAAKSRARRAYGVMKDGNA